MDGCLDDLEIAIELLRLGTNLEFIEADSSSIIYLVLAEFLAMRYDILEYDQDISEARQLVDKVSREMQVSNAHSFYRNSVEGHIHKILFKKLHFRADSTKSFTAYTNCWRSSINNTAAPAVSIPLSYKNLAEVLRETYYIEFQSKLLSRSHDFAGLALAEGRKLCQSWGCHYKLRESYLIMGKVQRSRFHKYRAKSMLDEAITNIRESVKLTGRNNSRFLPKVSDLMSTLRERLRYDQWDHFQRQLDRQEIINWVAEAVQARMPLRANERGNFTLELAHAIGDLNLKKTDGRSERFDLQIHLYQTVAEMNSLDFDMRTSSWRELAQVLIDKGHLSRDQKCFDRSEECLDKVNILRKNTGYGATGHLPIVARLYQSKYDVLGTPQDAFEAAKAYFSVFYKSKHNSNVKIDAALRYVALITKLTIARDPKSKQILSQIDGAGLVSMKIDDTVNHMIETFLKIVSRGLPRREQLHQIRFFSCLPLLNARSARMVGRTGAQILCAYEYGRAIIWDRLLNRNTQLELLLQQHPKLAIQYQELEKALGAAKERDKFFNSPKDIFQIETDLQDVVKQIEAKEGFEKFQQMSLSESEVKRHGSQGPIIFPIASTKTTPGFAIIVSSTAVEVVDLPHFNDNACKIQYAKLQAILETRAFSVKDAEEPLMDVLKWLWYNLAEPVLKRMDMLHRKSAGDEVSFFE